MWFARIVHIVNRTGEVDNVYIRLNISATQYKG